MVNEEILGGLRNALERGYSFEQAVQSFINAGYNPNDVREAAAYMSQGAISLVHPESKPLGNFPIEPIRAIPAISTMPMAPSFAPAQQAPTPASKPSFFSFLQEDQGKLILIGGIVVSLLIIFGALGYVLIKYAL
jgi:hypothetical protein